MQSERLFKEAPVWQAIGALVGPSVLSVLVMIIYNMTDLFFIGLLQDTALTAAVAVVGPVFTLASAGATVLGMGGCAVVAGSLGAGDRQDARCVSSLCGWCALLTGVLLAVVLNLFCEPILYLLGTNAEILPYATHYLRILALGAPAMIFSVSAATLLRADGAIRRGLVGNLAGSLTNILLDPLFILAFGWDIAGAAAATMLGNLVASGLYLHHILRRSDALSLRPADALRCPTRLGRVLTLGLPNGVSSLLSGLAGSFSNRLLAAYGTNALAAMAAADKSAMVVTLVQMGICMGLQPLLSYNVGGRNLPRLRAVLTRSLGLTVGFGTLFSLFCLLAQRPLIGLFLSDPEAAALARQLLPWLLAGSPLLGLYYLGINFLQAAGYAGSATLLSALRQGVLLVPALYGFHHLLGLPGLAAARAATDLFSAAIALLLFIMVWHKLTSSLRPRTCP
ncbi:MATE family efflux transporter [uncultured Subdoligranulum sp.]|uniref:MATE family efflux transporter n=1 Tax=uncultured Subdoligranulum sp. TaxID=512298 RepID=UPI00261750EE|nr:MATE family efflux transporter [uncultured Subdoligranulum sp.]